MRASEWVARCTRRYQSSTNAPTPVRRPNRYTGVEIDVLIAYASDGPSSLRYDYHVYGRRLAAPAPRVAEAQRGACRRRLHQLHGVSVTVRQAGVTSAFDFQALLAQLACGLVLLAAARALMDALVRRAPVARASEHACARASTRARTQVRTMSPAHRLFLVAQAPLLQARACVRACVRACACVRVCVRV